MVAESNGHAEVAKLLIAARANIDLKEKVRTINCMIYTKLQDEVRMITVFIQTCHHVETRPRIG